jgi:hypothetical protein
MRRTPLALLVVALAAACSSGSDGGADGGTAPPTSVDGRRALPADVRAFLDDVAEPGTLAFRATYRVFRKLGGGERELEVVAEPPSWQVRDGDLLFVDGPDAATCRISQERCVGEVREELLSGTGVFSRFFSTAPARALATDARRTGSGAAVPSTRTVGGVELRCLAVPVGGSTPSTYCLTGEGVFGWVDTPAVRYELIAYRPGPTGGSAGVPYPLTANGGFLTS